MRRGGLLELWLRLVCLAAVTFLLVLVLLILLGIDGWLAFETGLELTNEIASRIVVALGAALVVATAAFLVTLPYICWRPAQALERQARSVRLATLLAITVCTLALLGILIRWSIAVGLLSLTNREAIRLWGWLAVPLLVGMAACAVSGRDRWTDRYSQSVSGRATRRLLLVGAAATVLTSAALAVERRPRKSARTLAPRVRGPNIVLVTFDALSAEDMSCYGYGLPTTPNMDAFARSSHVFSNYYAVSTFTTSCIASMLTGCYPSATRVLHFGGSLRGQSADWTVSRLLHNRGYGTGASVANPGAHPACLGFARDFDVLPSPPLADVLMREATTMFGSALLATDLHFAYEFFPYVAEQLSPHAFAQTHSITPPRWSFQQGAAILRQLRDPFFLWVHVFAPHYPYLPEAPYLRRFLPTDELRTHVEFNDMVGRSGYNYSLGKQAQIDKGRLRYDEWLAQADGEFGRFMQELGRTGRLEDTAVIVSADHGESFQGGFLGHGGLQHLRPILHIPLLVHLPGQNFRQDIATPVDQTLLAPTILDIAGVNQPTWMSGPSLRTVLPGERDASAAGAFAQVLSTNSAFRPITHGTVGVIDGRNQYVLDLDSAKGALFDLAEAHEQRRDRSSSEPLLAAALRRRIEQRFPDIFGRRSGQA